MGDTLSIKQSILHEIPIFRDFEPQKTHHQASFFQKWQPFHPEPQGCSPATWPAFSPRWRLVQNSQLLGWKVISPTTLETGSFWWKIIIVMIHDVLSAVWKHLFKKKAAEAAAFSRSEGDMMYKCQGGKNMGTDKGAVKSLPQTPHIKWMKSEKRWTEKTPMKKRIRWNNETPGRLMQKRMRWSNESGDVMRKWINSCIFNGKKCKIPDTFNGIRENSVERWNDEKIWG